MSERQEKRVLLVGLPGAGKTSFIAALWHVLNAEEIAGALRLSSLGGEDSYLNEIAEAWLTYEPVLRTTQQEEKVPTMQLVDESSTRSCVLTIPDLSGETYRRQWVEREWSEEFDEIVRECSGLLVFVHPSQKMDAQEITPTMRLMPAAVRQEIAEDATETELWEPEKAAGVVQLVDVLQFIAKAAIRPVRMAIVVSAWDLVEGLGVSPDKYVSDRLQLLDQFLRANPENFVYKVFGLSALGVAIDDEERTKEFQETVATASERIKVVRDGSSSHDITLPVKWALGWEESKTSAA